MHHKTACEVSYRKLFFELKPASKESEFAGKLRKLADFGQLYTSKAEPSTEIARQLPTEAWRFSPV